MTLPKSFQNCLQLAIDGKVEILNFLELSPAGHYVRIQFILELTWHDTRLNFKNLREGSADDATGDSNVLTEQEREHIWVPRVVYDNTADKEATVNDEKTMIRQRDKFP